jgi:hypothetical protein
VECHQFPWRTSKRKNKKYIKKSYFMKDEKDCACLMCGQVHGDLLEQIA